MKLLRGGIVGLLRSWIRPASCRCPEKSWSAGFVVRDRFVSEFWGSGVRETLEGLWHHRRGERDTLKFGITTISKDGGRA